jgi:hypothetical protein
MRPENRLHTKPVISAFFRSHSRLRDMRRCSAAGVAYLMVNATGRSGDKIEATRETAKARSWKLPNRVAFSEFRCSFRARSAVRTTIVQQS